MPSKTIHPLARPRKRKPKAPASAATKVPQRQPSHSHGTRANKTKPLQHVAACAAQLFTAQDEESTFCHSAYHGHDINPDTGKIAEFRELSQCSEGPLWQHSNCEEIG
jgi:hypothetical protein